MSVRPPWRPCQLSQSEQGNVDAMRANFCAGAEAQQASESELRLVKGAIERNIPVFYRAMTLGI